MKTELMEQISEKTRQRFHDRYCPEPNSGCWLWTGVVLDNGYGQLPVTIEKKQWHFASHRVSWFIHNGPIKNNLCVLHKCDTRSCVNPGHLFLGTYKDNTHDMLKKGRHGNQKKTHCPQGHSYLGENLKIVADGKGRQCRTCNSIRAKLYHKLYYVKKVRMRKSHCIYGHPFFGENLYVSPDNRHICKICVQNNKKAWRKREKDKLIEAGR